MFDQQINNLTPVSGLTASRIRTSLGASVNPLLQHSPAFSRPCPLCSPLFFCLIRVVRVAAQVELDEKRMNIPAATSDRTSALSHDMTPLSAHGTSLISMLTGINEPEQGNASAIPNDGEG
jgi:hypothetical protein